MAELDATTGISIFAIGSLKPYRPSGICKAKRIFAPKEPAPEGIRGPWKPALSEELKEKWKGRFCFSHPGFITSRTSSQRLYPRKH